jgi:hypothetical protein
VATALTSGVTAIFGLALARRALPWAAVPGALAVGALIFVLRRRQRTLPGELLAMAALTFTALPVGVANGLTPRESLATCAVFYATSLLATVEVRTVAGRDVSVVTRITAWAIAVALVLILAFEARGFALSAIPMIVVSAVIAARRPAPTKLRQLGWTLAAASVLTAAAVVFVGVRP